LSGEVTLAASAACFRGGKVLIAKRITPPVWSLPGGKVENGETPAEAAEREIYEETGVQADIVGLAGEREVILKDKAGAFAGRYRILAFAARWLEGEAKPGPEASEVAWVEPENIASYKTTEGLLAIVLAAQRIVET
jgi:8-oxo-dGTP diphosphatase